LPKKTVFPAWHLHAKDVNGMFVEFLEKYEIKPELIGLYMSKMAEAFDKIRDRNKTQTTELSVNLAELQKKIDKLEEKYFITEEMSDETYKKLRSKYAEEKTGIASTLETCSNDSSNYNQYLFNLLSMSRKFATAWASSNIPTKEKLQKIAFPKGVVYNRKNQAFRTDAVNEVFSHIAELNSVPDDDKEGQLNKIVELSNQVGKTGFEPATT
jgi:site-specific DNA recombinase